MIKNEVKREVIEDNFSEEYSTTDALSETIPVEFKNQAFDISIKNEINHFLESGTQESTICENQFYECPDCSEIFQSSDVYELHKYIHNPAKECPQCKKTYKIVKHFKDHVKEHMKNQIKCTYCPRILFGKKSYISHIAWHKKTDKLYECSYCVKKFSTKKEKVTHERVHTNERPYQCTICDKTFKQNSSLKTHQNTHVEEKQHVCEVCKGTFSTSSSLKRHMKRIHATGRSMSCRFCSEEFFNLDDFQAHRMGSHPEIVKYFRICAECGEQFFTKRQYNVHRSIHIEIEEGPKRSKQLAQQAQPIDADTGEKENKSEIKTAYTSRCLLCGLLMERLKFYSHQNTHLGMTHKQLIECHKKSTFPCQSCGVITTTRKNALKHADQHMESTHFCATKSCKTPGPMTYMALTRHTYNAHQKMHCRTCNSNFMGYTRYKNHKRLYPCKYSSRTVKWYTCTKCKLKFAGQRVFMRHLNTHLMLNYFQCEMCNKKFPRFISFSKHMYVAHNKDTSSLEGIKYKVEYTKDSGNRRISPVSGKFYCRTCYQLFDSEKILEQHRKTHKFVKTYNCQRCKKSFFRQINYLYHLNKTCNYFFIKPRNTDLQKKFICSICDKPLKTFKNFVGHMTNIHEQKDFFCRYCNSTYNSLRKLRKHLIDVHPKEKKHFCPLCHEGFETFKDFLKHKKIHKKKKRTSHVISTVNKENPDFRKNLDIKLEVESDEEYDMPERVVVNENGEIEEC